MTGHRHPVEPGLWRFRLTLNCGHVFECGVVTSGELSGLTPRRKDGSFAALVCPHGCGRRRVIFTRSSRVGTSNRALTRA